MNKNLYSLTFLFYSGIIKVIKSIGGNYMKKIVGIVINVLMANADIIGTILIILFGLGIQTDEASFIAGFALAFGGVFIADEVLPLFFEELEDNEDEDE